MAKRRGHAELGGRGAGFGEGSQPPFAPTEDAPRQRTAAGTPLLSDGRHVRARGTARIGPAGRVVIPAPVRAALQVGEDDKLLLEVVGDQLVVTPQWVGMRWAQELAARLIPKGRSLTEELSADRAQEAADESKT